MTWVEKTGLTQNQLYTLILIPMLILASIAGVNIAPLIGLGERALTEDDVTRLIQEEIDLGLGGSPYQTEKAYTVIVANLTVGVATYTYAVNGSTGKLVNDNLYSKVRTRTLTWVMGNITSGAVLLKEVTWDTTVTINANELVIQQLNGVETWFDDTTVTNVDQPGSNSEDANYLVFNVSGTFFVKDGTTGEIVHSSAVSETEIQWAIDNCPKYGLVVVKGEVILNRPINMTDFTRLTFDHFINNHTGWTIQNPDIGVDAVRDAVIIGHRITTLKTGAGGLNLFDFHYCEAKVTAIIGFDRTGIAMQGGATDPPAAYWNRFEASHLAEFAHGIDLDWGGWYLNIARIAEMGNYSIHIQDAGRIVGYVRDCGKVYDNIDGACVYLNNTQDTSLFIKIEAALPAGAVGIRIASTTLDYKIHLVIMSIGSGTRFDIQGYDGHIFYAGQMYGNQQLVILSEDIVANQADTKLFEFKNGVWQDGCIMRIREVSARVNIAPGVGDYVRLEIFINALVRNNVTIEGAGKAGNNDTTPYLYINAAQDMIVRYDSTATSASTKIYIIITYTKVPRNP